VLIASRDMDYTVVSPLGLGLKFHVKKFVWAKKKMYNTLLHTLNRSKCEKKKVNKVQSGFLKVCNVSHVLMIFLNDLYDGYVPKQNISLIRHPN
jgi:hypothetical protein